MSKYIIELKDDIQVVQKVGVTENGNAFVMNFYKDQLEELNSDYISEHFGDLQDTAYQRGLEEGKAVSDKGCAGCKYAEMGSDTTICAECCNAYCNQWTAKQTDNEIKVGDEVRGINGNEKLVITAIESEYDHCVVMTKRGGFFTANLSSLVKTDKHYDIASILKEMQS